MSLEKPHMIDAIGVDEKSGRVVLVIRHEAPWDGSEKQLFGLQEKLNAYLSFALDGEMAEAYPEFAGRGLSVRIESPGAPDAHTLHFLGHVRHQIQFQDIELEMRVREAAPADANPGAGCGGGCHCH